MWHAEGNTNTHIGITLQGRFDLQRGDIGATGFNDIGNSSLPVQIALLVEVATVLTVKEAIGIEKRPPALLCSNRA